MSCRLAMLCCSCLLLSCDASTPNGSGRDGQLTLLSSYELDVGEVSGLALDVDGTSLWTVGGRQVHRLSLAGQILERLDFRGKDLEGIASDPADSTLWIVEEERREVVHVDRRGMVLDRQQLELEGKANSGLEGICLDSIGTVHVLNEKAPGLFVTLNRGLSIESMWALDFAEDFSGLDCSSGGRRFWILSDQSQKLFLWSPEEGVVSSYPLPFSKGEGVAVDAAAARIYIVSESEERLYVYSLEADP